MLLFLENFISYIRNTILIVNYEKTYLILLYPEILSYFVIIIEKISYNPINPKKEHY